MIEAAVFLVHEGSDEGQTAVDEVGLFFSSSKRRRMAAEVFNFKGEFYELVAKGVEGEMEVKDAQRRQTRRVLHGVRDVGRREGEREGAE